MKKQPVPPCPCGRRVPAPWQRPAIARMPPGKKPYSIGRRPVKPSPDRGREQAGCR
jgi:hypothetical protein